VEPAKSTSFLFLDMDVVIQKFSQQYLNTTNYAFRHFFCIFVQNLVKFKTTLTVLFVVWREYSNLFALPDGRAFMF